MAISIDPQESISFVCKEDRDLKPEEQTTFLLCPLTVRDEQALAKLDDQYTFGLETLRRGLRGWENFLDSKGQDVPFETNRDGKPTDNTIARIPIGIRSQIVTAIVDTAKLTEEELGKPGS